MTALVAFHGKPTIKAKYLDRVKAHRLADEIIHGQYWKDGKGCAVGCTIHGSDHALYETELGIPQSIAKLQDRIFEGLTNGEAKRFPEQFLKAIVPGADLSLVTAKFLVWALLDKKHGAIRAAPADKFKDCHIAILRSAAVWQTYIKTGVIDQVEAAAAADAAYAAYAAADAAYAAYAAADAAAYAADAAYAAYAAAAAAAAAYAAADAAAFWKAAATTLLKLLAKASRDK